VLTFLRDLKKKLKICSKSKLWFNKTFVVVSKVQKFQKKFKKVQKFQKSLKIVIF